MWSVFEVTKGGSRRVAAFNSQVAALDHMDTLIQPPTSVFYVTEEIVSDGANGIIGNVPEESAA